jgi:hypothetical protein
MDWVGDATLGALMQQYSSWQAMKAASDPAHTAPIVAPQEAQARDKMLHDEVLAAGRQCCLHSCQC